MLEIRSSTVGMKEVSTAYMYKLYMYTKNGISYPFLYILICHEDAPVSTLLRENSTVPITCGNDIPLQKSIICNLSMDTVHLYVFPPLKGLCTFYEMYFAGTYNLGWYCVMLHLISYNFCRKMTLLFRKIYSCVLPGY